MGEALNDVHDDASAEHGLFTGCFYLKQSTGDYRRGGKESETEREGEREREKERESK